MRDNDTTTPAWLHSDGAVMVDIASLDEFARIMRQELDNLMRQIPVVTEHLNSAVPFLVHAQFPETGRTARRYLESRNTLVWHLNSFSHATQVLADAAATIAHNYRGTDQLAAADLKHAGSVLTESTPTTVAQT